MLETVIIVVVVAVVVLAAGVAWWFENGSASHNEGVLKYTDFENISARLNTSWNLNKIVTVGENLTLTYTSQVDCHPMENALKMPSIVPVYEEDGKTFAGPVGSMATYNLYLPAHSLLNRQRNR